MIVSVPAWTCGTLPDTGASSIRAPLARTRAASSRLALGLIVLRSAADLAGVEAGQDPVGPRRDGLHRVVVGERRQDDVGRLGDLSWRVAPAQALVQQLLRPLATAGLAVDGVAGAQQACRHVAAHVPEPDEADVLHVLSGSPEPRVLSSRPTPVAVPANPRSSAIGAGSVSRRERAGHRA